MTTESKISNELASLNLTATTTPRSNTCDDTLIVAKGKRKSKNAFTQTDYDNVTNVQSIFIDEPKIDNQLTTIDINPFSLYQLPNEIIKLICHQLSKDKGTLYQCCLINKHLYAMTNPLLWEDIFSGLYLEPGSGFDLEDRLLTCLVKTRPRTSQYIRHFYLRGYCWNHTKLALLIPHVRHLVTLEIGNYNASSPNTDDALHYLPRYCCHLTSLSLSKAHVGRPFFASVGQHCHQLRRLRFFCSVLSPPDLFELLADCPLEAFYFLSYNPDDEMAFLNEKTLADFGKFDTLKTLEFQAHSGRAISRILEMPIIPWPRLTKLDLRNCFDIDDDSFVPFIKSHPLLEVVRLTHANISDVSVNVVSTWLPSLTFVTFTQCSNISLDAIHGLIQHARQLEFISLDHCGTILASDFPEAKMMYEEWMDINQLAIGKIKKRLGVMAESKLSM